MGSGEETPASHKGSTSESDTTTGRVRPGKKYLSENPQQLKARSFITKIKQLVERTPEEVQEELDKRVPSPLNDVVSYGASAVCWLVAQ